MREVKCLTYNTTHIYSALILFFQALFEKYLKKGPEAPQTRPGSINLVSNPSDLYRFALKQSPCPSQEY